MLFISGGYVLNIASTYFVTKSKLTVPMAVIIAAIIACWFINAYCVSKKVIGFIHWIKRGYENNEITNRSTTQGSVG